MLAVGAESNTQLADALKKAGYGIYTIGDCSEAGDALMATAEGAEIGRQI